MFTEIPESTVCGLRDVLWTSGFERAEDAEGIVAEGSAGEDLAEVDGKGKTEEEVVICCCEELAKMGEHGTGDLAGVPVCEGEPVVCVNKYEWWMREKQLQLQLQCTYM